MRLHFTQILLLLVRRARKIAKSDYQLDYGCPSVRMERLGSHWTDFHEIWHFGIFRRSVQKIQVSLKSDKKIRVLYVLTNVHFWWYLFQLFLEWEMFQTKVVEKFETHILCSRTFFFRKCCRLCFFFYCNNFCKNAPQCHVIRTLDVL